MNQSPIAPRNSVPGSISQVRIVLKYEFLNYLRSRRFYILIAIGLIISGLLTAVVGYFRPASFLTDSLGFYAGWWGSSIAFVIVLSGIFFGGDAISGEFQNKTGYFILPNPIRRSSIYVGKWLSAYIASSIILVIYAAITVANATYYFGANMPPQFAESLLFSWFYLAAILGFTFFFSSLFKSSSISILVTAILFLFVFSLLQTLVANLAQVEPWFILTYGAQIIGNILTVPYPDRITTVSFGPGRGFTSYTASIPEGLLIIGVYFIVTAILGLLLFEKKEFT